VACSKLLSRFSPTAIVAVNDVTAAGALHCASDRGVRIPHDLSIVGFDDIPLAEFAQPALTTVNIPRDTIGRLAFQALQELLRNPAQRGKEYTVTPRLVIRESTGKPKESGSRLSI
jgi:DNA-binding LacI/PurR family transcriptional regulator